ASFWCRRRKMSWDKSSASVRSKLNLQASPNTAVLHASTMRRNALRSPACAARITGCGTPGSCIGLRGEIQRGGEGRFRSLEKGSGEEVWPCVGFLRNSQRQGGQHVMYDKSQIPTPTPNPKAGLLRS